jgi:hypothetical protein
MPLPSYSTPTLKDLRAFWRKYRGNDDVRRLILEVQHSREVLDEIEYLRSIIAKAWAEQDLGTLVALEKLRVLMQSERSLLGVLSGLPPPPKE